MRLNTAHDVLEERYRSAGETATGETVLGDSPPARSVALSTSVPMWEFAADDLKLKCHKPVSVQFRYSGNGVFAECQRLHVIARGRNHAECVNDLQRQVGHFYALYTRCGEDEVTGLAAQLRQLYRDHFSVLPESD